MGTRSEKKGIESNCSKMNYLLKVPFFVIIGVTLMASPSILASSDEFPESQKIKSQIPVQGPGPGIDNQASDDSSTSESLPELLRSSLSSTNGSSTNGKWFDLGNFRWSKGPLNSFYKMRNYQLVWIDPSTKNISSRTSLFVEFLEKNVHLNGLYLADYWTGVHKELYKFIQKNSSNSSARLSRNIINFEIAMSQSLISFSSHLANGRLNPEEIKSKKTDGEESRKIFELGDVLFKKKYLNSDDYKRLNEIVSGDPSVIGEQLEAEFSSNLELYKSLIRMLRHFYKISERTEEFERSNSSSLDGSNSDPESLKWIWQKISSPGQTLSLNQRHPVISKIKRRFVQMGFTISNFQSDLYDGEFDLSLKRFQGANRIGVGSSIGPNSQVWTLLGKDLKKIIIPSIEANIERVRWLPRNVGSKYALVNTARSRFELYDGEIKPVMSFKTINGTPGKQTPIMQGMIKEVVLNPIWNVPDDITLNEFVPQILRMGPRQWFSQNSMRLKDLVENRYVDEVEDFNWEYFDEKNYLVVQDSGDFNALGVMKFPFSNSTNIYMHDTNRRDLFKGTKRQLSHGCIRLEKPFDLATYLLDGLEVSEMRDSPNKIKLNRQLIYNMTEGLSNEDRQTRTIKLPEEKYLPVYVLYLTAGVNESGLYFLTEDAYQQDERLKWHLRCARDDYQGIELDSKCYDVLSNKQK